MVDPPRTGADRAAISWHNQTAELVLKTLGSTPNGLSAQDAAGRLARDGPNELQDVQ